MEQIIVYLLPLFVLVDVILLVWGLRLVRHQPGLLTGVILALLLASILDNSILSLGLVFGQSPDLENLNRFRYLLNALLTPLLIWVSFKIAHESGAKWATIPRVEIVVGISTFLILITWLVISFMMVLKPVELGGMWRYNEDTVRTAGWIVALDLTFLVLVMFWMLVAGFYVWRRYHSPWLLAAGLLLLLSGSFNSLNIFIILSNAAEIVLQGSLLITLQLLTKYRLSH